MEKSTPTTNGIIRPKLLVPDKAMPPKDEKVIIVRGTIDPPKKT